MNKGYFTNTTHSIDRLVHTLSVSVPAGAAAPFAGFGAAFKADSTKRGYDLSDLSDVRLKIRGSGTVILSLKSHKIDSLNDTGLLPYIAPYHVVIGLSETNVDTTFTADVFHLDAEDAIYEANYPWSGCADICSSLFRITFVTTTNNISVSIISVV